MIPHLPGAAGASSSAAEDELVCRPGIKTFHCLCCARLVAFPVCLLCGLKIKDTREGALIKIK